MALGERADTETKRMLAEALIALDDMNRALTTAGEATYTGFADAVRRHLDSPLPKEPEVHDAPSGRQYRKRDDGVIETRYRTRHIPSEWCNWFPLCETILIPDAPVVAKLMEAK